MNEEEKIIIEQAQANIVAQQSQANAMQTQTSAQAQMMQEQERSIVESQLDLTEELERIEHLLRGHIIKRDKDGNEYWDEDTTDSPPPLNEYGVRIIIKFISFYLNKNKLLSNYNEEMINAKMEDFSIELADLIFMKYREMGLDTVEKRKMYSSIVREVQDTIHDTYLRALAGKERASLRKHWNISENVGIMPQQQMGGRSLNPLNWLKR